MINNTASAVAYGHSRAGSNYAAGLDGNGDYTIFDSAAGIRRTVVNSRGFFLGDVASPALMKGVGFPNGVVTAPIGSIYIDTAVTNEQGLWYKRVGTGNTGWVGVPIARPDDWYLLGIQKTRTLEASSAYFEYDLGANYAGVRASFICQTASAVGSTTVKLELIDQNGNIIPMQRINTRVASASSVTSGSAAYSDVWSKSGTGNNFYVGGSFVCEKPSGGAWGVGEYRVIESADAIMSGNLRLNNEQYIRKIRVSSDVANGLIAQGQIKVEVRST